VGRFYPTSGTNLAADWQRLVLADLLDKKNLEKTLCFRRNIRAKLRDM
jgi:hypothetical protein